MHPLIFLWTPKDFISPEYFLNFFLKPVYTTMITETFQIHGGRITGKYNCETKNWICSFLLMPPYSTFLQVFYYHYSRHKEITFFPETTVFENPFSPVERGRIVELKKWPKLNLWGYWSQVLISSTFLQPLHFRLLFYCAII